MRRLTGIAVGLGLMVVGSAAWAFEEQKMPQGGAPGASHSAPTAGTTQSPMSLGDPGLPAPRLDSGTKIRVPGLGIIGEIPKMDFGLELLYGATQPKQLESDRTEANGVMGRVTVPLKSR